MSSLHSYALHLQSYRNYVKEISGEFHKSNGSRFGGSEKDRYFLKIPKWQHKHVRDYKRGKLDFYFLNNAAKTCLYGLKNSENIEIEYVFQSKVFFFISVAISTQVASAPLTEGQSIHSWSKRPSGDSFEAALIFSRSTLAFGRCKNCESIYQDSTVLLISFQWRMFTSIRQICMTGFIHLKKDYRKEDFGLISRGCF